MRGKKYILWFIGGAAIIYIGSVFMRAYLWEKRVEEHLERAMIDIAQPWTCEKLEQRASWWFREKAKLSPCEIVDLARQDYGNLNEIASPAKCNIQRGKDKYSEEQHTYAICLAHLGMEKKSVVMTIRLITENGEWKINDFISVK